MASPRSPLPWEGGGAVSPKAATMGGYLEKMGSGMLKKKWQRYWCVLFRGEASPGIDEYNVASYPVHKKTTQS